MAQRPNPIDQLRWLLERSVDDPEFFIVYVLRPKLGPRWVWQRRVCQRIAAQLKAGDRSMLRVLIRSCHGAGKTWLAAALVLWWIATRPTSRVLTLAQSWAGVENLIWPNIATLFNGSLLRADSAIEMKATEVTFDKPPQGGKSEWYAVGASTDQPARLEGHHSKIAAMRVIDEAKEVEPGIFTATEGMLDAPENFDLWISTPSIAAGEFYKRDTGKERAIREVIDADQLIADGVEEKRAWKERLLEKWGEHSPDYQARVLARYVDNADGALFPSSWVERAMGQGWTVAGPQIRIRASLDVAGSVDGDRNALAIIAGPDVNDRIQVRPVSAWHERDTMITKGRALAKMREAGTKDVRVDVIGLGKGVADALRGDGVSVGEYRSSDKPLHDAERFANRKAADCWHLRTLLEKGLVRLPDDQELKAELVAMRYRVLTNGKTQVVDPADSPDLADAVVMGIAGAVRSFGYVVPGRDRDDPSDAFLTPESMAAF